MTKQYHPETLAIHAGQESPDPATNARAVPVYRTTAYNFNNSEHGANLFALKELGNIYSRLMNPTNDILEKRLAALEGGAAGLTLSSGTAAVYFSVRNILRAGDELVSANNLYGGTFTQFDAILPNENIKVHLTPVNDFKAVEKAINAKTRAVFIETIGNPVLDVADVEGYAEIAKKHKLPLIVDSTFTTPFLLRPIDYGANIVIHSLSKWIGGHGTGIGGIVIDDGKFDWKDKKFALYNEPDGGYHGLKYATDLGPLAPLAFILRLRTVGLRNQGPTLAPDAAWIFLQGVESLALRIKKHSENALAVAEHLAKNSKVEWVRYPGLKGDPSYKLAQKYLPNGQGGMVVFGLKGDKDGKKATKFVDNIKLFSLLANVGDAKSLIIHSASTTHSQLSEKAQGEGGLHKDLIRLSVGIEHIDDIIGALDDALKLV
ncbi:MAG: O-acetylhomoserine aminocarboxypropyltransferase/cysteine synthase [Planctomycetaceae bacterium]|jgi:O-acetylhomoserine (thiol)-lyase|nr:O-acetylhomoserine aminocarboxypropyltransferase/cysteine synthase [Planctomycetaceae bacterium]